MSATAEPVSMVTSGVEGNRRPARATGTTNTLPLADSSTTAMCVALAAMSVESVDDFDGVTPVRQSVGFVPVPNTCR